MPDPTELITVGVDGSPASREALRWAVHYAELERAVLEVVTAWSFPEHPTPFGIVPELPLPDDPLAQARQKLEAFVAEVVGEVPPVEIRTSVVRGSAAQVLVEASHQARLLIVGSRGLGTFRGVLLGSVSERCVRHAACPVVVVRAPEEQSYRSAPTPPEPVAGRGQRSG
jgi:nucleotide-binding universal stress UspA family protein